MSSNKDIVEAYMTSMSKGDRAGVLSCLAEDVEWIEWYNGVPISGDRHQGKDAFNENLGEPETGPKLREEVTRLTEERDVVVAEGTAHVSMKDGSSLTFKYCDIFELENGKVKRLSSFTAKIKDTA